MTTNEIRSYITRHLPTALGLAALVLGLAIILLGPWPIAEVYRSVWDSIAGFFTAVIGWSQLLVQLVLWALGLA